MPSGFRIVQDDIRGIPSDSIITLANPDGIWRGQLDMSIEEVAADFYAAQLHFAWQRRRFFDGLVIHTSGAGVVHGGSFSDILYVIDTDESPLRKLVFSGLVYAQRQHFEHVTMPLMRSGNTFGVVERTLPQIAEEMKKGICQFRLAFPTTNLDLTIAVRNPRKYSVVAPILSPLM